MEVVAEQRDDRAFPLCERIDYPTFVVQYADMGVNIILEEIDIKRRITTKNLFLFMY